MIEKVTIFVLLLVLTIVLNSLAHGLRQRDVKNKKSKNNDSKSLGALYHTFWWLEKAAFLVLIFFQAQPTPLNMILIPLTYLMIRFGIFDALRNIANGQNIMFIGSTAGYDIFLAKYFDHNAKTRWLLLLVKAILAFCGFMIADMFIAL